MADNDQRFSPHAVAALARKRGLTSASDKVVRRVARETVSRFDKSVHPARQTHAYTADEARAILTRMLAQSSGQTAETSVGALEAALAPTPAPKP